MNKLSTLFLILFTGIINAAEESPFLELDFALWPEYDHPGILVLMEGTFRQEALPITLEFRVPDEAGAVGATFSEAGEDIPFEVPIETRSDGKWAVIEISQGRSLLRTGYYFDPFIDPVTRDINYVLELNQPVEHFHVQVQEPLASEDFVINDPTAQKTGDPTHGFTTYTIHMDGLTVGEQKLISFSYRNPTRKLSVELLQQMMTTDSSPVTDGGNAQQSPIPMNGEAFKHTMPTWQPILILVTVAFIVGLVYVKQNKNRCPKCKSSVSGNSKYCNSCGTRLS
ncbi:MAG: hypothetical protein ACE5EE_05540 [Fidelibacterota bacterium]